MDEQSRSEHILDLAKELLDDIELSRTNAESLVLKTSRLARWVGSEEIRYWLKLEMGGYNGSNEISLKYMGITGRWINKEKQTGYWGPLAQQEAAIDAEKAKLASLRTPDSRFENLQGYDFRPFYFVIDGYRIHYLDEGEKNAPPILLLHGEPSWSYLYRKMIPILVEAGFRVVVPDLLGFGRSDKPIKTKAYSYQLQVDMMTELARGLDLKEVTFFGQDWGGLIGLRVVAEDPERFARIVIGNSGLPAE